MKICDQRGFREGLNASEEDRSGQNLRVNSVGPTMTLEKRPREESSTTLRQSLPFPGRVGAQSRPLTSDARIMAMPATGA